MISYQLLITSDVVAVVHQKSGLQNEDVHCINNLWSSWYFKGSWYQQEIC